MRFPPKSYNKELESAEDRREREAQVDNMSNYIDSVMNRGSTEGKISAKTPNFCVFWVSMAEFGRNFLKTIIISGK